MISKEYDNSIRTLLPELIYKPLRAKLFNSRYQSPEKNRVLLPGRLQWHSTDVNGQNKGSGGDGYENKNRRNRLSWNKTAGYFPKKKPAVLTRVSVFPGTFLRTIEE